MGRAGPAAEADRAVFVRAQGQDREGVQLDSVQGPQRRDRGSRGRQGDRPALAEGVGGPQDAAIGGLDPKEADPQEHPQLPQRLHDSEQLLHHLRVLQRRGHGQPAQGPAQAA